MLQHNRLLHICSCACVFDGSNAHIEWRWLVWLRCLQPTCHGASNSCKPSRMLAGPGSTGPCSCAMSISGFTSHKLSPSALLTCWFQCAAGGDLGHALGLSAMNVSVNCYIQLGSVGTLPCTEAQAVTNSSGTFYRPSKAARLKTQNAGPGTATLAGQDPARIELDRTPPAQGLSSFPAPRQPRASSSELQRRPCRYIG